MSLQQPTNVDSINLEKDILSEYEKLGCHIDKVKCFAFFFLPTLNETKYSIYMFFFKLNATITHMNTNEIVVLVDKLRILEKKIGLVYTLFKASVYSLSLITTSDQENVNIEGNTNRPPIF